MNKGRLKKNKINFFRITKKAFSFIEIAIAVIVVGIFLSLVFYAKNLIAKSSLSSAQNLTRNSGLSSIKDLESWLETSSDKSFSTNEKEENNYLSVWHDIKNYGTLINASQSNVSNKPTYSSGIKNIPTVKFNGSSYFEFDGSFLNNSDYTIFFLEKRLSNKSNNYFLEIER